MKHIRFFRRLYDSEVIQRDVYSAACAVGVASTFGAPIGGVLFSIEVTSTFFLVTNYWRGFVAAGVGAVAKQLMDQVREGTFHSFKPMFPTSFEPGDCSSVELAAFLLLGMIMGLCGPVYIRASDAWRGAAYRHIHDRPFMFVVFTSLLIGLLLYTPGENNRTSIHTMITTLCHPSPLPETWSTTMPLFVALLLSGVFRMVATILSTSLPVPAGDFLPLFVCGAAFGRWYGELLLWLLPNSGIVPGGYAVVGGAALVGAVTHTISVAGKDLVMRKTQNELLIVYSHCFGIHRTIHLLSTHDTGRTNVMRNESRSHLLHL